MKKKSIELDVDFIGSQEPLTKEEEKEISDFIQSRKLKAKKGLKKQAVKSRKKELA